MFMVRKTQFVKMSVSPNLTHRVNEMQSKSHLVILWIPTNNLKFICKGKGLTYNIKKEKQSQILPKLESQILVKD